MELVVALAARGDQFRYEPKISLGSPLSLARDPENQAPNRATYFLDWKLTFVMGRYSLPLLPSGAAGLMWSGALLLHTKRAETRAAWAAA